MSSLALSAVSHELEIPDPRKQPVPAGWCERTAAPVILVAEDWDSLDEYEARLKAFASYVDSFDGDALEFEKALRVIEKRRGDLLGKPEPGKRTDLQPVTGALEVEASAMTVSRWRTIASHWDDLWPVVLEATERSTVTQSALLRRAEMGVHYSSERGDWETPQDLFDALDREFGFELDVCATAETAKCQAFFGPDDDGLAQEWTGTCWMNPPYGTGIDDWIAKASDSAKSEKCAVVCLVPARVDTSWWHDICRFGDVRFLRGRIRFGGGDAGAPFPSAVVAFPGSGQTAYWDWKDAA